MSVSLMKLVTWNMSIFFEDLMHNSVFFVIKVSEHRRKKKKEKEEERKRKKWILKLKVHFDSKHSSSDFSMCALNKKKIVEEKINDESTIGIHHRMIFDTFNFIWCLVIISVFIFFFFHLVGYWCRYISLVRIHIDVHVYF